MNPGRFCRWMHVSLCIQREKPVWRRLLLIQCVVHLEAEVGSAVHCVRTAMRWERAVYIPFSATRFLAPHTTHLWPHIVLFFDNRFSYIMNPIHIKGWTKGRLAWLQAHSEQAQTTWENKLFPIFSSPFPPTLLFVIPQALSSVRGQTCVADHMHNI